MKHFFISVVFTFITSLSFAQPINLSIDKYNSNEVKVGDTLIISLNVEKYNESISSFQLFLEFDQQVLKYVETKEVNKLFNSTWRDNKVENLFVGTFLSSTLQGFILEEDEIICQLLFVYEGGETDLVFGKKDEVKDGVKISGETIFVDLQNKPIQLILNNGCVCSQ